MYIILILKNKVTFIFHCGSEAVSLESDYVSDDVYVGTGI